MVDWNVLEIIKKLKPVATFHVLQIVSGQHGVVGPDVLTLVEKDYKKERGLKLKRPKMVENHVSVVTSKHNIASMKLVQEVSPLI